jgi:hypothetical protein
VSEEDVKNKVVLPMLRALGYDDSDFNYERRTGRGYVDVVAERFPCGIVVATKAPQKRLDQYIRQLEHYVFDKHGRDRTTIAILTDGESFNLYGVNDAFCKGDLDRYLVMSFARRHLKNPSLAGELSGLLGRESNQKGAIPDAITSYKQKRKGRIEQIQAELSKLKEQRRQIDAKIQELETELSSALGPENLESASPKKAIPGDAYRYTASRHIPRLLGEHGAHSRAQAVDRAWLDGQLVNKVTGVRSRQAVSFGLIELKKKWGHRL